MPNQIEPNVNNTLGDLLRGMMPGSCVAAREDLPMRPRLQTTSLTNRRFVV